MERIKKETLFLTIIFCIFAISTFVLGIFHEPWADEAHALLIARDTPIKDLIPVIQYEGHPLVWYLILKFLCFIHFPYEAIFLVPWGFSLLGIWLFLFKSKFPLIIKSLFPFTWFIFYQFAIIARNHSIVFPILCIIAIFYKNRLKHPFIYSILLIILSNISAYSFVIACVLSLFLFIDIIKYKKFDFKTIFCFITTLFFLILTIFYMKKPKDCTFLGNLNIFILDYFSCFYTIATGYFITPRPNALLLSQIPIITYILGGIICCKNCIQITLFIFLNLGLLTALAALYCNYWHSGYIIITFIFSMWILLDENNIEKIPFKKHFLFYIGIIFLFMIQIIWSIKTIPLEIKYDYSAGKKVAEFIKENKLNEEEINGIGHKVISIQPYFEKNIYQNFKDSYFPFKRSSKLYHINSSKKHTPTIIVSDYNKGAEYREVLNSINDYYKYEFDASVIIKGERLENGTIFVYTKKKLD